MYQKSIWAHNFWIKLEFIQKLLSKFIAQLSMIELYLIEILFTEIWN